MKLGKAIKVARVRKGWTQQRLAEELGVTPTYVSLLERDLRDPSWSFVNRLADTLGVPLPLLLLLGLDEGAREPRGTIRSVLAHELLGLVTQNTRTR